MSVPLVDIIVVTYNQEKYIEAAIHSIATQKSDFSFRIIISDDNSTDTTHAICKQLAQKYSNIALYRNEVNLGISGNYVSVLKKCTAKYIAILEGDDFYKENFKLQKQVDLMEQNAEVGLVHSNYEVLYSDGTTKLGHAMVDRNVLSGQLFNSTLLQNRICPATVCFRTTLLRELIDLDFLVRNDLKTVDLFLWLGLLSQTKVGYIDQPLSVYRLIASSVSNSIESKKAISFFETADKILGYYQTKLHIDIGLIQEARNKLCYPLISKLVAQKDFQSAAQCADRIVIRDLKSLWYKLAGKTKLSYVPIVILKSAFSVGSLAKQTLIKLKT